MRVIQHLLLATIAAGVYANAPAPGYNNATSQCRGLTECGCTVVTGCGNSGCTELYGHGIGLDGPAKTLTSCTANVERMFLRFDGDIVSHYMTDAFTSLSNLRYLYIGDLGSQYRTSHFNKLSWIEEVFIFGDGSKAVMSEQLNDGNGNYYAHMLTTPGSPLIVEGTVPNEDALTWYNVNPADQSEPVPTPSPAIERPVGILYMVEYNNDACNSVDYSVTKTYVGQCAKDGSTSFKLRHDTILSGVVYTMYTYPSIDCSGIATPHFKSVATRSCVSSTLDPNSGFMFRSEAEYTLLAPTFNATSEKDCAHTATAGVWDCQPKEAPTMYPTSSPTIQPTHVPTPSPTTNPTA